MKKIFGSELLFLGVVVDRVFFDSVLPVFLFYNLVFRSRKCLGKILFVSGLLFRQPYCHTLSGRFSPFSKGEMLSVFLFLCFLCLVRCLLSFFYRSSFLGSLFEKIFGSELLFLGVGVGRVFFGAVLPMFLLYCLVFRSRKCLEKILLMSGLVFGFFFLFLWFFSSTSCFLFF